MHSREATAAQSQTVAKRLLCRADASKPYNSHFPQPPRPGIALCFFIRHLCVLFDIVYVD